MPIRTLVVDDEPVARQVLREQLEEFSDILVTGEAATGLEAVEQVSRLSPEVVFLDLQMPGLNGFGVARALRGEKLPLVVYVTAFEKHALEAFETGAVDYLLKPVRKERLAAALEKVRLQLAGLRLRPAKSQSLEPLKRITGRLGADLHLINLDDVIAFVANNEEVEIITAAGRYHADHTLKALEQRLPAPRFRRIHRGTIINTDHIRKISPLTSKRWLLRMSNNLEAVVSKRMAGVIRETTSW